MPNLKPLSLFVFFFSLACERIFSKTRSTESTCVIGPENILLAGASVHLSARIFFFFFFLQAGSVKGLTDQNVELQTVK